MSTSLPVVFVTMTDTTTVGIPSGFTTVASHKTSDPIPTLTRQTSSVSFVLPSSTHSGSASTSSPLPSERPTPTAAPKDAAISKAKHNDIIAILALAFLVLLCLMFVLFLAFFLYSKLKGECSKCKELQETVSMYASGKMAPITKQTCKDRDSYFKAQEKLKELEEGADRNTTWSLGFNAGPEYRHSVQPPVPKAPTATPYSGSNDAGPSQPRHSNYSSKYDSRSTNRLADIPETNRMSSSMHSVHSPYNGGGLQNPYVMNGIPNGDSQPRKFATYRERDSQPRVDEIIDENLGQEYLRACTMVDREGKTNNKRDGEIDSILSEESRRRHRSAAYGRFTPPPSPLRVFRNVDLDSQESNKPGWKVWQK